MCTKHTCFMAHYFSTNFKIFYDTAGHVQEYNTTEGAGTAILTFLGGFHPQTQSLWLSDMA